MDKSTILAMEGRELDKLVATEVMGEPIPEFTPENALDLQLAGSPVKSPKGNWLCLCAFTTLDIPTWRPLPFSSSSAFLVVEELKRDWTCIQLVWDIGAWDIVLESYVRAKTFYLGKEAGETYEHLPEAIRYCNDRPACIEGAKEYSFFKGSKA